MNKVFLKHYGPEWTLEDINTKLNNFIDKEIGKKNRKIISIDVKPKYGVYATPEHYGEGVWADVTILYKEQK